MRRNIIVISLWLSMIAIIIYYFSGAENMYMLIGLTLLFQYFGISYLRINSYKMGWKMAAERMHHLNEPAVVGRWSPTVNSIANQLLEENDDL